MLLCERRWWLLAVLARTCGGAGKLAVEIAGTVVEHSREEELAVADARRKENSRWLPWMVADDEMA